MVDLDGIRRRKQEALARTYGYFLVLARDEVYACENTLSYACSGLNPRELKETRELLKESSMAREYYKFCFQHPIAGL